MEDTEERATDAEPKTVIISSAKLVARDITDQTIFSIDAYGQTAYVIEGRSTRKTGNYHGPIRLKRTSIFEQTIVRPTHRKDL
jgi:hypothetical protein